MDVFCFDFDGVICDSAPETALSAWQACGELWPEMSGPLPTETQARFCRLRPVLHTGFEAIPLMRLIALGTTPDAAFFSDWAGLRDRWIRESGLSKPDLLRRFGAQRDRMIAMDEGKWVQLNPFYPGMAALLNDAAARHEAFILTTKQERFARLLLQHNRVSLAAERVFGLEHNVPKPAILGELMARPGLAGRRFHFIEDRLETLQDVITLPGLNAVRLYLVDWGYNTPAQRDAAAATPRIQVVSPDRLRAVCAGAESA